MESEKDGCATRRKWKLENLEETERLFLFRFLINSKFEANLKE
jgi:hypothetical protein